MQYGFRFDKVGAQDLVEGKDGPAKVFGDQIGRGAGGEGEAGGGEGIGGLAEGFVVTDIGNKCGIRIGNQVVFQR